LAIGEYLSTAPWRNIHTPLYEGGHTPLYEGILACSSEYPKLNTWTEANLGKFLSPLLYEGLFSFSFSMKVYLWDCSFLLYKSLFLLYEGLAMGSKKSLLVQNLSMV
jgi:hypothetical protein